MSGAGHEMLIAYHRKPIYSISDSPLPYMRYRAPARRRPVIEKK